MSSLALSLFTLPLLYKRFPGTAPQMHRPSEPPEDIDAAKEGSAIGSKCGERHATERCRRQTVVHTAARSVSISWSVLG